MKNVKTRKIQEYSGKGINGEIRKNGQLYLMLAPGILFFLILSYLPMAFLFVAFQDYNVGKGIFGSEFVGLANFQALFSEKMFPLVLRNTLLINFYKLIIGFPFPILLALCFNELKSVTYKKVTQSLVYLPHFLSWVVVYGIMISLFSVNSGLINKIIISFGMEPIAFLTTPQYYRSFLVVSEIWKEVGWNSIIYIAALAGLNIELYEAATIDGASRIRQLWHIALPGIRSTMVILFILNCGAILSGSFEQIMVTINSSVFEVGEIIPTYVYTKGLTEFKISFSTAVGLFQSAIGFLLVFGTNKIAQKMGGESLW